MCKTYVVPKPIVYFSGVCVTHVLIRAFSLEGLGLRKAGATAMSVLYFTFHCKM